MRKPILYFVSDFETLTQKAIDKYGYSDTQVILANTLDFDTQTHTTSLTIDEWWSHLKSLERNMIVMFHNLDFDGAYIIPFLLTQKYKYVYQLDKKKDINKFSVFQSGKKIYYIRVQLMNKQKRRYYIEFRCSYKLLNDSIEKLGEAYGIKKHEDDDRDDFYDEPIRQAISEFPPRFVQYIKNDTLVACLALKDLIKSINALPFIDHYNKRRSKNNQSGFNVLKSLTASSLAVRLMKEAINHFNFHYKAHNRYLTVDKDTHEFFDDYYAGAISQVNENYIAKPQSVKYALMIDVVSAYPAVMTGDLPYGSILSYKPKAKHCTFISVRVKHCVAKMGFEHVPLMKNWPKQWHNNKYLDYYDPDHLDKESRYIKEGWNFMVFYLLEEWQTLHEFYHIEIYDDTYVQVYMKSKPFIKQFINEVYKWKEYYSKHDMQGMKQAIKIILNSGYGAMAKRTQYENYVYVRITHLPELKRVESEDQFEFNGRVYRLNHKTLKNNFLGSDYELWNIWDLEYENLYPSNKACASVITARQRINIMQSILRFGVQYFLYTDTDSLVLGNLTKTQREAIMNECGESLGAWEVEFPKYDKKKDKTLDISYFGSFGSKRYDLLDQDYQPLKQRFAGVSEKISKYKSKSLYTLYDGDEIHIENACLRPKQYPSGIVFEHVNKTITKGTI